MSPVVVEQPFTPNMAVHHPAAMKQLHEQPSFPPAVETNGANGINGINGVNGVNSVNGANGVNGVNGTHETDDATSTDTDAPSSGSLFHIPFSITLV